MPQSNKIVKHIQTRVSVFNRFVGLALKGLTFINPSEI